MLMTIVMRLLGPSLYFNYFRAVLFNFDEFILGTYITFVFISYVNLVVFQMEVAQI